MSFSAFAISGPGSSSHKLDGLEQLGQRKLQLTNVNPSLLLPPISTVMTQPYNCVQISFLSSFYNRLYTSSSIPGWSYIKSGYIYFRIPMSVGLFLFTQPYSPIAELYILFLSLCMCPNREVTLKENYWAWCKVSKTKPLWLLLSYYKFKGLEPSDRAFLVFS